MRSSDMLECWGLMLAGTGSQGSGTEYKVPVMRCFCGVKLNISKISMWWMCLDYTTELCYWIVMSHWRRLALAAQLERASYRYVWVVLLLTQVDSTLPALIAKSGTVGVFVPSTDQTSVERCLDRQYSMDVSELAASISHYLQALRCTATSVSDLGLYWFHHLLSVNIELGLQASDSENSDCLWVDVALWYRCCTYQ